MNFKKSKKRRVRQNSAVLNNGGGISQGYLDWSLAFGNNFHMVDEKLGKLGLLPLGLYIMCEGPCIYAPAASTLRSAIPVVLLEFTCFILRAVEAASEALLTWKRGRYLGTVHTV